MTGSTLLIKLGFCGREAGWVGGLVGWWVGGWVGGWLGGWVGGWVGVCVWGGGGGGEAGVVGCGGGWAAGEDAAPLPPCHADFALCCQRSTSGASPSVPPLCSAIFGASVLCISACQSGGRHGVQGQGGGWGPHPEPLHRDQHHQVLVVDARKHI